MTPPAMDMSHDKRLCGRPRHQADGTCQRPAGWGTPHPGSGPCKLHGGSLPVVIAAEGRRAVEAQAVAFLEQYGWEPVTNPVEALSLLAGETDALRQYLAARVAEMAETGLSTVTKLGAEQVSAVFAAYERALDRCGRILTDMAKLNIEDRLVRIGEVQTAALLSALDRALSDPPVGLGEQGRQRAKALLAADLDPQAVPA